MSALLVVTVAGFALALAVLIWLAVTYNKLVRQRNQVRASWAQIDVQLARRHDLVPNLVAVVKGYAGHERATLEAVVAARRGAVTAGSHGPDGSGGAADRAEAEHALTQTLGRLFALAEGYPQLRADQNFAQLQQELAISEDKIAYARQFYNSAVQTLANTVHSFPSNLVGSLGTFRPPPYFAAAGEERGPAQVRF